MVSLVGYVLVSQAVDYEAFICWGRHHLSTLVQNGVGVRMTPRHELWMDEEAIY